jgi:hypothetical protein
MCSGLTARPKSGGEGNWPEVLGNGGLLDDRRGSLQLLDDRLAHTSKASSLVTSWRISALA